MNWCDVTDPKFSLNPFQMKVIKMLKVGAKQLFKPCPIAPEKIELLNYRVNEEYLKFLPRGVVKGTAHFYNDEDENVFTMIGYLVFS